MFLHGPSAGAAGFVVEFDEDQGLQKRFPALAKRDRRESCENCTFQHSVRTFGDLWYVPHFELDVQQFFVIEGSCRSRLALELDGQQFFAVDGSCRSRPAHEELDGQQFFAIEGSCRRKISKWKPRAQVVREFPQSPQGRLRHQRPRSAGYDCVNNATVRKGRVWLPKQHHRFEDAQKPRGGHPSCVQAR